jgi:hypothetical protein
MSFKPFGPIARVQHPLDTGRRGKSVLNPASLVKEPDFDLACSVNMVDPLFCRVFNQNSQEPVNVVRQEYEADFSVNDLSVRTSTKLPTL